MAYEPKVYKKNNGDSQVIANGGDQAIESGGSVDYESGAALKLAGTDVTTKLANLVIQNDAVFHTGNGAIAISGIALITGGTGIAGLTLAAPTPGCRCEIRIDSLSSGNVVITTGSGITFDGSNNTATLNAAAEALILTYKSATEWEIVENVGSVALSSV